MHTIFGLIIDHNMGSVHHLVGHLDAAHGGKTVHKYHILIALGQHFPCYLVRSKQLLPFIFLLLLSDPPSYVCIDYVGSCTGFVYITGVIIVATGN